MPKKTTIRKEKPVILSSAGLCPSQDPPTSGMERYVDSDRNEALQTLYRSILVANEDERVVATKTRYHIILNKHSFI